MKYRLIDIYNRLFEAFGKQHWWPADSPFEVSIGAILTQNTNWCNVEKAINSLKENNCMNASKLHSMSVEQIAKIIRPAGYFNIKAKRLKHFIDFLVSEYKGDMNKMKKEKIEIIREKLLSLNGIGPETADSILLYALDKPVFVIDAYTKRVLSRHNIMNYDMPYSTFQELFHSCLKRDVEIFNEYHALFVRLAKEYCRKKPLCKGCPLEGIN